MNTKGIVTGLIALLVVIAGCDKKEESGSKKDEPAAVKQESAASNMKKDWYLSVALYTFRDFTFAESAEKLKALGLHNIECWEAQIVSKENPAIKTTHLMNEQTMNEMKSLLTKNGLALRTYYIQEMGKTPEECRKSFEFAKAMGVEAIISEPTPEQLDMIEPLCKEYKIKMAIHNHAKPPADSKKAWVPRYWNPETVLEVCKGRSELIGSCADTGHWARSGLNPVEMLKKLQGRIICVHLKDLNEFGKYDAYDVPWGTGVCDAKGILAELARQNFKGVIAVEYERNWENLYTDVAKCIEYFDKTAAELGYERQ